MKDVDIYGLLVKVLDANCEESTSCHRKPDNTYACPSDCPVFRLKNEFKDRQIELLRDEVHRLSVR
jgi:hypothetical protein